MYLIEDVTTDGCSSTRGRRDSCVCVKAGGGGCPWCLRGLRCGGALRAPLPFRGRSGHRFRSGAALRAPLPFRDGCRHFAPFRTLPPPFGLRQLRSIAQRASTHPTLQRSPTHYPYTTAQPYAPPPLQRSPTHFPLHYTPSSTMGPAPPSPRLYECKQKLHM